MTANSPHIIQSTLAVVERIAQLTATIVELILIPDQYIDYISGQYLRILMEHVNHNEPLYFSIANAAFSATHYEVHIKHDATNFTHIRLFEAINNHAKLKLQLPFGECHVERLHPDQAIVFIAGGTGFAPIKSMLEHLILTADPRKLVLYWIARSTDDLYMQMQIAYWQKHIPNFEYVALIYDVRNKFSLFKQILAKHPEIVHGSQIILAGAFDMVYGMRDELLKLGISSNNLFADAFSFEK